MKADFGFELDCNTQANFRVTFSEKRRALESRKCVNEIHVIISIFIISQQSFNFSEISEAFTLLCNELIDGCVGDQRVVNIELQCMQRLRGMFHVCVKILCF